MIRVFVQGFVILSLLVSVSVYPFRVFAADKIRLGYSGVGSGNEIYDLVQETGLFKKHGLDVEIIRIPGGTIIVQALIANELTFGRGQATEVINAHLAGYPLKIIAVLLNKFMYQFVTPASISKPQQLKGKAVAVSRFGSGSDFVTRMVLKSWGLEPGKDVTILQVGNSPARFSAMLTGKVYGSILDLALAPRARKMGLRILGDLSQLDVEYPQGVLYVPRQTIEKRPDLIVSFLKAFLEGIRYFKTNRQAAFKIISKSVGLNDQEEIQEYYEVLTKKFVRDIPMPTVASMRTVLDESTEKNPRIREIKADDLMETRFLTELQATGSIR